MNFSRDTSGREGLDLLRQIRASRPQLPVILMTAWGSISLAVEGVKAGASDFITKPWSNQHLLQAVETLLSLPDAREDRGSRQPPPREELDRRFRFGGLVGDDPAFLRVLDLVGRVSPTDASVLITGESGTGKELIAEAIHENSRRSGAAFVKVNLGGISSTLFESEMFGHVRGAFTDARNDRQGRFEVADGGTIFLDEIGELDPSSQVKLLRVLQDRTYEVLGSSTTRSVDVRIVSATNRDLTRRAVSDGGFREDLLYRSEPDHGPLARAARAPLGFPGSPALPRAGHAKYGRDAIAMTDGAASWLEAATLAGEHPPARADRRARRPGRRGPHLLADDLETLAQLERPRDPRSELPRPGSMTLDEMERAMIENCMRHYAGNVTRAAEALGVSRAALYRRLEKYGLAQEG